MSEETVIVPGDPENRGLVCITDDGRPDPSHCWMRARSHILAEKRIPFFVALEAATICRHMAEAIQKKPFPPRRAKVTWGFGKGWPGLWGAFITGC